MEVCRRSSWLLLLLGFTFLAVTLQGVQGEVESEGPSESECRPYIEKALKELETGDAGPENLGDSKEDVPTVEITTDDSAESDEGGEDETQDDGTAGTDDEQNDSSESPENVQQGEAESAEKSAEDGDQTNSSEEKGDDSPDEADVSDDADDQEEPVGKETIGVTGAAADDDSDSKEDDDDAPGATESKEDEPSKEDDSQDDDSKEGDSKESDSKESDSKEGNNKEGVTKEGDSKEGDSKEGESKEGDSKEGDSNEDDSKEDDSKEGDSKEGDSKEGDSKEGDTNEGDSNEGDSKEGDSKEGDSKELESKEDDGAPEAEGADSAEESAEGSVKKRSVDNEDSKESSEVKQSAEDAGDANKEGSQEDDVKGDSDESGSNEEDSSDEPVEDDLTQEPDIPDDLRPRDHIEQLLKLDDESRQTEKIVNRVADITLRDLKRLYENAIKPLEVLYKYRDLSNRHFGDPEIFSKPLVLFMGPWSGGKSSIINYLLDNEYNESSLRTGAEPSPAYFNILMHGDESEVLDGTQLAADFTFSGLQKFGQGLEERLRGHKLPAKLLEKINLVEIPGILEVRKQISRLFPFNDACQWFIDRADIIFLVYDPSKLDVGPETEAILDQLKGREHQTRIILNKADQVKPEELMRVQGALIWNISPLMSSAQPPVMYTTSLWSRPYESWAPVRLLQAQERAFLRDLRSAYDHRIENKIASARRFAVRVRNHAKMVDCYLTTYYNHKSVFGNRKQVADLIIEHPQDYHIYEGLSTLTNISRYDLPDPDVYRDFFRLNPLYEFQQLSATCTYFRGCPINRLDVAIAYDLPELVGKHKRMVDSALAEAQQQSSPPDS